MMSEKALRIARGEEKYPIEQFEEDLRRKIELDEEDEDLQEFFFNFNYATLLQFAVDLSDDDAVKFLANEMFPGLGEDLIRSFVENVRTDWKEELDVLKVLFIRKYDDFIALGASEAMALDLLKRWIREEILYD